MHSGDDCDEYGRPLCQICGAAIRPIENVPSPDGGPVHFYCFPVARAGERRAVGSRESAA